MSTTDDPQQIRREIEYTQRNLSADVDALTEKVTPSKIVQRRTRRVRRGLTSVRDRVMGTVSDAGDRVRGTVSNAGDQVAQAKHSATDTISDAPQAIRRGTEGNPLAAGLIAFGLGWLTASLIPASRAEERLAEQAKDVVREHSDKLGQVASDMKDRLTEPAQQAAQSVKETAQDAAGTVADETRSAAGQVTDRAQDAKANVQQHSSSS